MSNQVLKSGTSIGANVREAQNAESKNDFIHKMKIAAKEADETVYWLILCQTSEHYPNCDELLKDLDDIFRIIGKIILKLAYSQIHKLFRFSINLFHFGHEAFQQTFNT